MAPRATHPLADSDRHCLPAVRAGGVLDLHIPGKRRYSQLDDCCFRLAGVATSMGILARRRSAIAGPGHEHTHHCRTLPWVAASIAQLTDWRPRSRMPEARTQSRVRNAALYAITARSKPISSASAVSWWPIDASASDGSELTNTRKP